MTDPLIVGPLEGLKVLEIGDLAEITGKLLACLLYTYTSPRD